VQGKSVAISFHFAVGKSDPAAINIYTHRRQVAADFTHHTQQKGDHMQIDCYGFEASSQWFRRKELEVYLMKEVEGILYLCYGNQPMRPIHRIDHDEHGCTRESWAFGRWADVESLRYIPVNQTMEIDAKDWEAT
jgi:hypothetical protein